MKRSKAGSILKLDDRERVVVAYAENVNGPGWSNSIINVIVRELSGKLREECIQPVDQTPDMCVLFEVNAISTEQMTNLVSKLIGGE